MSEYQYYEFQALDRPLTQPQMDELRKYSSRAQITPTGFVNTYNWGNFKGDASKWMEVYFDAFVYVANWGTRQLMFRIPKRLLDLEAVESYCEGESLSNRVAGEYAVFSFDSEEEEGDWEEGEGWLGSLTPLRSDLMRGDFRSLYLGWLGAAQSGCLDDDALEPPVPPGLGELSEPLQRLVDFLRIDSDLVDVASEASATDRVLTLTHDDRVDWVARLSKEEKESVILALLEDQYSYIAIELRQRAVRELESKRKPSGELNGPGRRSVGELMARAGAIAGERRAAEAQARARKEAERERVRAEERKTYLKSLVDSEDEAWSRIEALIATKQPRRYDDAVLLLQDLRDAYSATDRADTFSSRMDELHYKHEKKPALLEKFRKARLIG